MTTIPPLEVVVRLHHDSTGPMNEKAAHTKVLAFAELTIGGSFIIKSIRIIQVTLNGVTGEPFVVFPGEKIRGAGRWYDLAHPCTAEARHAAITIIMRAFRMASGGKA